MRTNVAPTSIAAYHATEPLRDTLKHQIAQHIVARTKRGQPSWIGQTARDMNLERSTVSGLYNALHKEGHVEMVDGRPYQMKEVDRRRDPVTGVTVQTWSMVLVSQNPVKQPTLFDEP